MNLDPALGERQIGILQRVGAAESGQIVIDPQTQNAEWCAAKRLVKRGFLTRHTFGSRPFGKLTVYTITDKGREKLRKGTQ